LRLMDCKYTVRKAANNMNIWEIMTWISPRKL
jgi:hypothetical protein